MTPTQHAAVAVPRLSMINQFAMVHRTGNPALQAALWSLPAWADVVARLRLLDASAPATLRIGDVQENLAALILEALDVGRGVPADLAEQAEAIHVKVSAAQAVAQAVEAVRDPLTDELDTVVRDGVDDLLLHLRDQLAATLEATAGLDHLHQLADAETAIRFSRVEDYQQLQQLGVTYRNIRDAQASLLQNVAAVEVRWPEATLIRNLTAVFPGWPGWRRFGYRRDPSTHVHRPITAPWPNNDPSATQRQVGRGLPFLTWAVQTGVELWVPTVRQLAAATAELAALHDEMTEPPPLVDEDHAAEASATGLLLSGA